LCCRGKGPDRGWRRSTGPQQKRFNADTARDAEHWQKWIRVSRREGAAARDYAAKDPIFLPTPNFLSIAAGTYHTCMLRNPGLSVFCHGNNNNGQSGPTPAGFVPTTQMAVGGAAGGYQTCSVQPILFGNPAPQTPPGGVVECWGENGDGQVNGVPGGNVTVPAVIIDP